jgi:nucleolar protein 56
MQTRDFLRKKLIKRTRQKIEEKFSERETHIAKAIKLFDDLEATENLLREGHKDWEAKGPTGEAQKMVDELSVNTEILSEEKKHIVEFIENQCMEEIPCFTGLATPIIAARMLAQARSLRRMAFMPGSTIQILGAEKALFNHLRKNKKCPKHGFLFNHPLIQNLPKHKRGKAARLLGAKLALAAKIDYFKGEDISKELYEDTEKKIRLM